MLSREKEPQFNVKTQRNNTIALTYDIQNTSTKLVMLNLSNKNENRIREHSKSKDHSILTKDFRCCYCLSNAAPACACHHRDKDLSQYPKRHECCSKDHSKRLRNIKSGSFKKNDTVGKEVQWPELSKAELTALEKKSKRCQSNYLPERYCDKDLWLLSSIPALTHPDFSLGQRKCLLSLAKIYTNVSPGPRYTTQRVGQNVSKLAPIPHRNSDRKSRSKSARKTKTSKRQNSKKRKGSLPTAVCIFQNDSTEINKEMESNSTQDSQKSFIANDVPEMNSYVEFNNSNNNDDIDKNDAMNDATEVNKESIFSLNNSENNSFTQFNENKINVSDDESKIDELELSNHELDFILNDYVMNILQQQANNLQFQISLISSEKSFTNKLLENVGLQSNVEWFDYQEIPDNIIENSTGIEVPLNNTEKINNNQHSEYTNNEDQILFSMMEGESKKNDVNDEYDVNNEHISNHENQEISNNLHQISNDKDKFNDDNISVQQKEKMVNDIDRISNNEDIITDDHISTLRKQSKSNSDINYCDSNENAEIISKAENESNDELNNLDNINPEVDSKNSIEFITVNPLRILSQHLRQSISS